MVFVDDVATAVLLAAERDAAVGEEFLVSGSAPVTWRDFTMPTKKWLGNKELFCSKTHRCERRKIGGCVHQI